MSHSSRSHARLAASGAHRWLECTKSVKLEEQFADTTSPEAEEGTVAHELAETKATEEFLGKNSSRARSNIRKKKLYSPEMEGYTDEYIEMIKSLMIGYRKKPFVSIEERLDLSAYIKEGFGTCDCILIGEETITVIDFKYGKGVPVDSENNPQMMLYALGAYEAYKNLFVIKNVRMCIVQPRINNNSTWECNIGDLLLFGEYVKQQAALAYEGEGDFKPGEWCRFCKAKATCRARAEQEISLAFDDNFGKGTDLLTNEEIGRYLELGNNVSAWLSDLAAYALSECLAGREVAGYKAVNGRSSRNFDDVDKAFEILRESGVDDAMLWEKKPMSVAKLEKALGKKEIAEIVGDMIVTTPGKPTLAKESDKREAINSVEQAFK